MRARILVSGGGRLRVMSSGRLIREMPLDSCGAVCAGREVLFVASDTDRAIYRLDQETLLPCGVYAGGPGTRTLCASSDGERLYALISDADSVLMLDGKNGAPEMLARVGVNPQHMRLDDTGETLAIAGGEDGRAVLLSARTLRTLRICREEGICCDALYESGAVYALMFMPSLSSRLVLWDAQGQKSRIDLPGTPGSLCCMGGELLVSAGERLYVFSRDGLALRTSRPMPAHAGRLIPAGEGLLLLDPLSETLFTCGRRCVKRICADARDAALLGYNMNEKEPYSS